MGFFGSGSKSNSGGSKAPSGSVQRMADNTRSLGAKPAPAKGSPWSANPGKGPGSKSGKK
jgi:hypothetical protein